MTTLQEVRTQQDVLNYVAPLLLDQGAKSHFGADEPAKLYANAYRGEEGRKCAIGHLIPDEEYRSTMEGQPVAYLIDMTGRFALPTLRNIEAETGLEFLVRLQQIHDQYEPAFWRDKLNGFADHYGLDRVQS